LALGSLLFLLAGCRLEPEAALDADVRPSDDIASVESAVRAEDNLMPSALSDVVSENKIPLSILAWNVESGGADPEVIAKRLTRLDDFDIVCLSEVNPDDFQTFEDAKGPDFDAVNSKTGNEDRLQIIYNQKRFELLQAVELDRHGDYVMNNGGHRSPTAVRLKDRVSGKSFVVMVNHLARGNADFRKMQAIGLREWARDQDVALINIGDFNMDYEFASGKGNDALDEILRDNIWKWVEPKTWIDSNWWDPEGDGIDNFDGSLLDFAFVAGPAKTWNPHCEVMVELGDFPDDASTSDHRPIALRLSIAP
jgi:endonuclease/exonuclease/phosphatase family metal-dependent hydrolase